VNSLSCIPPSLAELPLRRKTSLLLGLYEFLLRATFIKALRQSEAIPGAEVEKLKLELHDSKSEIENATGFKEVLASAEAELKNLTMMGGGSSLAYRATSLDTLNVLQNLLPHVKDAQGNLLPFSKNGAGMVSLQSFLLVLAIAQKRKSLGKNFILIAEEPELHLHPALHKRLTNRIRAVSTQSLITTHSPQVAAAYKPSESIHLRNLEGNLNAQRLRTEPVKDIPSNAIRQLYLQKREAFYEAILGAAVVVPEGQYDYEWLRHLQRIMEVADNAGVNALPFSIVPTQDGQIGDTYVEVARFNATVLPMVDGDPEGQKYRDKLCELKSPPKQIVQLGEKAAMEVLVAWLLEPCLSNPGPFMTALVPQATGRNMKALQRALEAHKKDRDLHENLMAEALENSVCASRAAEFFMDLSLIVAGTQPKNAGWKQLTPTARGTTAYIATHICKE
jgi:putative ATP-dependent endonuclease of OLD family